MVEAGILIITRTLCAIRLTRTIDRLSKYNQYHF